MTADDDFHSLDTLLSQVVYHRHYNGLEGLHPIAVRLDRDRDGKLAAYLWERMPTLEEKIRGGIAFTLAHHFHQQGDLPAIRQLYQTGDATVQASVLDGLWDSPENAKDIETDIIALMVEGMQHPDPDVRYYATSRIASQNGWGVRADAALEPLLALLADPCSKVRHGATYSVGHLAKKKYDLAPHLDRVLSNLQDDDISVRKASAWALRQLSRRYDIGGGVTTLIQMLRNVDEQHGPNADATTALLHHARKNAVNRATVQDELVKYPPDEKYKLTQQFLLKLNTPK